MLILSHPIIFPNMITYRNIVEPHEFQQVTDMETLVWNMEPEEVVGSHTLKVIVHTGGNIIGAFDGDLMVGCVVAFAMRGEPRLWSHFAAVHPEYQRQGIGYALKQQQREWALTQGYQTISWSVDPLMAANAHFNLQILGARTRIYHVNFYGAMHDAINAGLPSDRFEMWWSLHGVSKPETPDEAPFLLTMRDNQPIVGETATENWHFVEIPVDFPAIRDADKSLALAWKEAMRETFQPAFAAGYEVVNFVRHEGRNWYVLNRS